MVDISDLHNLHNHSASTPHTPLSQLTELRISIPSFIELQLLLLILSGLSIPYFAYKFLQYTGRIAAQEDYIRDYSDGIKCAWKLNTKFAALMGLVERYLYKKEPWGPWDAWRIREHWPDKHTLKRLTRGGVIPLEIAEGGLRTYQKRRFRIGSKGLEWPLYVQSEGRAYFYFIVLYPHGQASNPIEELNAARTRFMRNLITQETYPVTASYFMDSDTYTHTRTTKNLRHSEDFLEAGAESWCKWFLPFKRDRVLRDGQFQRRTKRTGAIRHLEAIVALDDFIDSPKKTIPLLAMRPFCVVRMEALDYTPVRLDNIVYQLARQANFTDLWPEDEASRAVGELYAAHGIDYKANPENR
jgi:hypothetical protein